MRLILDVDHLGSLRGVGDKIADDVVSGILKGSSAEKAGALLARLTRALRGLDDIPDVRRWVERAQAPPPWVRTELVVEGQQVFTEWSLDIVAALFCASLPFAYAAAKGVEVLDRISQLADSSTVARRIAETGQLLLDISQPGALAPGGRGYQTTRTVRLLHAVIRARLTLAPSPGQGGGTPAPWDNEALGVPVNQEDLLGTLLSFTTVVFRALDRLGITLGLESQESYLHLWATVGNLLGIESAELVLSPLGAEALTDRIAQELHAPSAAGVHLMEVLMGEMELSMPWGLRKLPRTLVRHLSGDGVADMLGVAPMAWWGTLVPALAGMSRVTARLPAGRSILQAPSHLLGRSMIRMWIDRTILGDQPTPMRVDGETLARLKIHTSSDRNGVGLRGRLRGFRRAARLRHRRRIERAGSPGGTGPTGPREAHGS